MNEIIRLDQGFASACIKIKMVRRVPLPQEGIYIVSCNPPPLKP